MSKRECFDPYPFIWGLEVLIMAIYLFGGLLFLIFEVNEMTTPVVYMFLLSWFSLFLSITCIAYLIILPYKEIHVLIHEKYAELTGEKEE